MNQNLITFEQLEQSYEMLKILFDSLRIVDPIKKKVITFIENTPEVSDFYCYDFWEQNKVCNNCISMRAYIEKNTFFKLECTNSRIYLVISIPIMKGCNIVILELLKEVTGCMVVEGSKSGDKDIFNMLNNINQLQMRDGLTNLFNRRYIDERLPANIFNSFVEGKPISIIFGDIDHFKYVNDNHGHLAGDFVLKEFSSLLLKHIDSKQEWAGRYGGEEFLIVLQDTDRQKAEKLAENIRKSVEEEEFEFENKIIKITSSFGVSTLHNKTEITAEAFIESADKNLYLAKTGGRNKVVSGEIMSV